VIGEGGVGKTTLIRRFVTGEYSDQSMTIGLGFASKTKGTDGGKTVKLQIWDVSRFLAVSPFLGILVAFLVA
jgi:GTPase SAR1 family protein